MSLPSHVDEHSLKPRSQRNPCPIQLSKTSSHDSQKPVILWSKLQNPDSVFKNSLHSSEFLQYFPFWPSANSYTPFSLIKNISQYEIKVNLIFKIYIYIYIAKFTKMITLPNRVFSNIKVQGHVVGYACTRFSDRESGASPFLNDWSLISSIKRMWDICHGTYIVWFV